MKVIFNYNTDKDIWCLLNKGKSSNNSANPTEVYQLLVDTCGENPSEAATVIYIDEYLKDNHVSLETHMAKYAEDWSLVSEEFYRRAEDVFGVALPNTITAYLTINNRCPYSISDNLFYVTVPLESVRKTIMHELWHFYTWYGLGPNQQELVGQQKYNDLKEALTVLLNEECGDLLPAGIRDIGYPQHQKLREEIVIQWSREKDIRSIWHQLSREADKN